MFSNITFGKKCISSSDQLDIDKKMAERRLVVSELLCFLCYKFNKCQALSLKTSIVDFYSPVDIAVAKDLILEEARRLKLENLPRRRA